MVNFSRYDNKNKLENKDKHYVMSHSDLYDNQYMCTRTRTKKLGTEVLRGNLLLKQLRVRSTKSPI